ncbi:MAG TPA: hypothetical protein EYP28_06550 [Methanophagales archaeon]|nr:hypothetical protein [Methanophagales archaeon]
MKKVSILVTVSMVALIFAAAGIASAITFRHTLAVSGDGLVAVNKEVSTGNLTTQFNQHGCGNYSIKQVLDYSTRKKNTSISITLEEDAAMAYKPETLQAGMPIPGDGLKFRDDLCIKNRHIGATMSVAYTYADSIIKETRSEVSYLPAAELDIQSRVTGAAHVGVLLKDPNDPYETRVHVSEDYIGTFYLLKWLEIKDEKKPKSETENETEDYWLVCPSNGTYPETGWEWCPTSNP